MSDRPENRQSHSFVASDQPAEKLPPVTPDAPTTPDALVGWSTPVNLGKPVNTFRPENSLAISTDGTEMIVSRANGNYSMFVYRRPNVESNWSEGIPLQLMNGYREVEPHLSYDSLTLMFGLRIDKADDADIYVCHRESRSEPWSKPLPLPEPIRTPGNEGCPWLSKDGLTLWFESDRGESPDVWVSKRDSLTDPWQEPRKLGPNINDLSQQSSPAFPPMVKRLCSIQRPKEAWT